VIITLHKKSQNKTKTKNQQNIESYISLTLTAIDSFTCGSSNMVNTWWNV